MEEKEYNTEIIASKDVIEYLSRYVGYDTYIKNLNDIVEYYNSYNNMHIFQERVDTTLNNEERGKLTINNYDKIHTVTNGRITIVEEDTYYIVHFNEQPPITIKIDRNVGNGFYSNKYIVKIGMNEVTTITPNDIKTIDGFINTMDRIRKEWVGSL